MPSPQLQWIKVFYYDDKPPDVIPVGQWECILSVRKYGEDAMATLEGTNYAVYQGGLRSGVIPKDVAFDAWLFTVSDTKSAENPSGEAVAPLEK